MLKDNNSKIRVEVFLLTNLVSIYQNPNSFPQFSLPPISLSSELIALTILFVWIQQITDSSLLPALHLPSIHITQNELESPWVVALFYSYRATANPSIHLFFSFFLIIFEWCDDWRIGGGGVRCSGDVLLWCL